MSVNGAAHVSARSAQEPQARVWQMLLAGLGTVGLLALVFMVPVPYVSMRPGPAVDTLGSVGKQSLISIEGRTTYPTKGHLYLTTVSISGGPGSHLDAWTAIKDAVSSRAVVVPREQIYPKTATAKQIRQENKQEMSDSQQAAGAAALREVGIEVPVRILVNDLTPEAIKAKSPLRKGDILDAVQGRPVGGLESLRLAMKDITVGAQVQVRVLRNKLPVTLPVTTGRSQDGRPVLGVFVSTQSDLPFTVKIAVDNIGGPSAGMMFALGVVDKLTPGSLTGGKDIAGTGTIDADGLVGPIGGIGEKLLGAHDAGARYFLAPAQNCDEGIGQVPDGLSVFKVANLHQARLAVEGIAKGDTSSLTVCPAKEPAPAPAG